MINKSQMHKPAFNSYGLFIRRHTLGLNLADVAKAVNVSLQTVQAWETGKWSPNKKKIPKLSRLLGVEPSFWLEVRSN